LERSPQRPGFGILPKRTFPIRPRNFRNVYAKAGVSYATDVPANSLITVDPEILGGTPVFAGTRVPVKTFFEYLEDNYSLDEFIACFPTVSREMAHRVLERSKDALLQPA
jgi:uncharacterized protein (DUF433 family)